MVQLGDEAVGDGPEKFKQFLNRSMETWHHGAEYAGIKPQ